MPERFSNSIVFRDKITGKEVVQIEDSFGSPGRWLVCPVEGDRAWLQYVLEALNLKDRADQIAPLVTESIIGS